MSLFLFARTRLMRAFLFALISLASLSQASLAGAYYFALDPVLALPTAPTSLLVQSPGFVSVPAGAVLSVHLLRGDAVVATSRLTFNAPYSAQAVFPAPPVAAFFQPGAGAPPGQPLTGATLAAGGADLAAVAANPSDYRLLWQLSAGQMAMPGQAVFTGNGLGVTRVRLTGVAASARPHVEKPGSLLVFPHYASSLYSTAENTTVAVTNTSPTEATQLRVLFYSAADCQAAEYAVCLGAEQTLSFKMSDYDPGVKGYCIAYATDASGQPIQFNHLVGSARLTLPGAAGPSYDATLDALTLMKRSAGAVSANNGQAELAFDDLMYDRLPNLLALDTLASQASGQHTTTLVLTRLSSSGTNARMTVVNATGDKSATATKSMTCQTEVKLPTLRLNPTLNTLVPAGATGWMKVSLTDDSPLLGLYVTTGGAHAGGSLRALSYATDFRLQVPVKAVTCQ